MSNCIKCGKTLDLIEIGLYKKLVNRGASEFMCKLCLSEYMNIPVDILDRKIVEFRKMGCTLFPAYDPDEK